MIMNYKSALIVKWLLAILCGLLVLAVWGSFAAKLIIIDDVTIKSAGYYQMNNLLSEDNPKYDISLEADLVHPKKTKDVMPAFIFMHGSGGRLYRHEKYLELARELGFVTLQVDSFGGRDVSSTVGSQTEVTAAMMAIDALRALKYLASRSDIDAKKVTIMGSSKGAIAALYAAWTPIRKKVAGDLDFAGYALLYPICVTIEDDQVSSSPVHIFAGKKDNWTPPAPCIKQVEKMKLRGRDWGISLFEGAYHAFDSWRDGIRDVPNAYSYDGCDLALRADGTDYDAASGYLLNRAERRLAFETCGKKGSVKVGGNHAVDALLRDLRKFLESILDQS